jgi:hypothetical protein
MQTHAVKSMSIFQGVRLSGRQNKELLSATLKPDTMLVIRVFIFL